MLYRRGMHMDAEHLRLNSAQSQHAPDNLDEPELLSDEETDSSGPRYEMTERIFRLLHLLVVNDCTRRTIFESLGDFYNVTETDDHIVSSSSQRAGKMLLRDMKFLEKMGYQINKSRAGNSVRYSLVKGSGPQPIFLFSQSELDALILLHTLFADPAKYAQADTTQPLPLSPPRNPFAEDIQSLVEHLVAILTPEQKKQFDRWTRKPFIFFHFDMVIDYLPHRATIDTILKAISHRQQIRFDYASMHRLQGTTPHEQVDPYYVVHQDGHLYLIGYSHKMNTFYEYRIDRIEAESLKRLPRMIDGERRRRPIEFSYWIDGSIAKSGLSQRWLTHTIEQEEVYLDEQGKQRRRVLVRAKAYSEWRIIQQLHKYADKVELVDPPKLRERMRQEVERMYNLYQK